MGAGASAASSQKETTPQATVSYKLPPEQAQEKALQFFQQITAIRNGTAPTAATDGPSLQDAVDTVSSLNDLLSNTVSGAGAFGQLINASGPAMEGLLSLGAQVPMFGAFAGALLMFYGKCKTMGANSEALKDLVTITTEAGEYVDKIYFYVYLSTYINDAFF
jgi:hypothetical protein